MEKKTSEKKSPVQSPQTLGMFVAKCFVSTTWILFCCTIWNEIFNTFNRKWRQIIAFHDSEIIISAKPHSHHKQARYDGRQFFRRLSSGWWDENASKVQLRCSISTSVSWKKTANQGKSIDDFVPEETIDSGFLDENDREAEKKTSAVSENDSSDESDR